jgi:hypothetical protein
MFVITFLTACASIGMQGRIEDGRYFAPNGKISFIVPNLSGPKHAVRDIYGASSDRGFFEEKDIYGLQAMYYASLASLEVSPPSNTEERRSVLNKGLTNFVMQLLFLPDTPNAEVVHQEYIVEQGKEMLLALVREPERSGASDLITKKRYDAYPAVLVLAEGGYVIALSIQSNLIDIDADPLNPKDTVSHYLKGLRKLKSGLKVRQ